MHFQVYFVFLCFYTVQSLSSIDCEKQRDSNGHLWTQNLGRSQILDFIQHSAKAKKSSKEKSLLFAKGKALSELRSECGHIPERTKLFEKCVNDKNESFVRYSVKVKECNRKDSAENKLLLNVLNRYHKEILLKTQLDRQNCINEDSECIDIASALLSQGDRESALSLLSMSCDFGSFRSCYFTSRLLLNKFKKSKMYFLKGCKKSSPKTCLERSFQYEGKKANHIEILMGACDMDVGVACYKLSEIDSKYKVKKYLSKACLNGSKDACLELVKMNLSKIEREVHKKSFCRSGITSYCKKNNQKEYDLMDNLEDDEISIKPLEI